MSAEAIQLLRELYEHWQRGDLSATGDAFDPNVQFIRGGAEFGGVGLAGEWHGVDEMWAAIKDWLSSLEDVRLEAERFCDLGDDRVLVLERQTGRGKRSGAAFHHEIAELVTFRDGKIVRWETYYDRAEGIRAAGLEDKLPL